MVNMFRGWDESRSCFWYSDKSFHFTTTGKIFSIEYCPFSFEDIEQCVDVHDKNGEYIWEGDYASVRSGNTSWVGRVIKRNGAFVLEGVGGIDFSPVWNKCSIVGHIHMEGVS